MRLEDLAPLDLSDRSSVHWAGNVPLSFVLAREFTERWDMDAR